MNEGYGGGGEAAEACGKGGKLRAIKQRCSVRNLL